MALSNSKSLVPGSRSSYTHHTFLPFRAAWPQEQKENETVAWGQSLRAPSHLLLELLHRLLEGLGDCSLVVTEDSHSPVRPVVS